MSKLLYAPLAIVSFIDSSVISSQVKTSTWIVIGALLFQTFSLILTRRIVTLLAFLVLFARVIPTILISAGKSPNKDLEKVVKGKTAVMFPRKDGSPGSPGGRGFALLILGVRISHPLGLLAPGAKETGAFFMRLVEDLKSNAAANGYLTGTTVQGEDGTLSIIAYFESMDALHAFAHAPMHREAWNWWNKNVKSMPHLGVYHEAYDIPAHHWETIYLQTPRIGLGKAEVHLSDGQARSVITDARRGIWRSSAGRMGRAEGRTYNDEDPYNHDS